MADAYWKMTYASDRRKHNHRCRACQRVVQPGDSVFMARIRSGVRSKTKVIHESCGDNTVVHGCTELQLLECHGMQYLAHTGDRVAQAWLDFSPLTKTRNSLGEL